LFVAAAASYIRIEARISGVQATQTFDNFGGEGGDYDAANLVASPIRNTHGRR